MLHIWRELISSTNQTEGAPPRRACVLCCLANNISISATNNLIFLPPFSTLALWTAITYEVKTPDNDPSQVWKIPYFLMCFLLCSFSPSLFPH